MKFETPIHCRIAFVLILLFMPLVGCFHSPRVVADERGPQKDPTITIPWLVDAKTTKEEVMENCQKVEPLGSLSQGKIIVYAVNYDQEKGQLICSLNGEYQLVLIFDEKEVVKRHSIVKYRFR